jgi:D-alanine transaminase
MISNQPIGYLDGVFQPLDEIRISPLDRGFLFADGVYEVVPVYNGHPFRLQAHLDRLTNSLAEIRLDHRQDWPALFEELIARNGGGDLSVYLQVTRGAPVVRDHAFPQSTEPTVFAMARPLKAPDPRALQEGLSLASVPDIRWGNCHIKSVALLANVLARQQAVEQGADDAILIRDGQLTETSAGNLYLISDGAILTPRADRRILHGITRGVVLELARAAGIPCRETDLPAAALNRAEEVWTSSSTKEVLPVTRIDGRPVGDGRPGPVWQRIRALFQEHKREVCGGSW